MAAASQSTITFEQLIAAVKDKALVEHFKQLHKDFMSTKLRDDDYHRHQRNKVETAMVDRSERAYNEAVTWAIDFTVDLREELEWLPLRKEAIDALIQSKLEVYHKSLKTQNKSNKDKLRKIYNILYQEHQERAEGDEARLLAAFHKLLVLIFNLILIQDVVGHR